MLFLVQIRLNALGLLVEGPKATQLLTLRELQWTRRFIDLNLGGVDALRHFLDSKHPA